jgi:3-dehydroquinate dehydratase/shikimate dehydrogenase
VNTRPLVCVTVTAPTTAELRRRRDQAAETADLIELRLDSVADPDVAGALAGRTRPVIVTCRPAWEGGAFDGPEEERRRLLGQALICGAEYVDVEWRAGFDEIVGGGRRIVLSFHDFDGVPADLSARVRAMRATGAEIVKVAVQAKRLTDCLPLLDLGAEAGGDGGVVLIAMGERGLASRVLAGRFGSVWTYAGCVAGVGQLAPRTLLDEYRFRSIGNATAVYGVAGLPVAHSVSPAMHNAAFRSVGCDAVYLPLPAADADDFVGFAKAFGLRGASVTIPFKVAMLDRVDEVDPVARRIGALNTICVDRRRWVGRNSDVSGFLHPLESLGVALEGRRAAVLGAGGSARAVAIALADSGARVSVHARRPESAEAVATLAAGRAEPWPPVPGSWDLLVNCTPVGMHPRVSDTPLPAAALTGDTVYDLVYNPGETRLLREAAAAGCRAIGGLDMLVAQAQAQFEWWTGTRPDAVVMKAAAMQRLAEFTADETHVA